MIYAGIGARVTPAPILEKMHGIAQLLGFYGWSLRSGGATGADSAFEAGCRAGGRDPIVYRRSHYIAWHEHAARYHPAWDDCNEIARELHARNSAIICGPSLDTPVDMVVCWTFNGRVVGGTGQALRIAAAYNIPVFNLALDPSGADMWAFVKTARS